MKIPALLIATALIASASSTIVRGTIAVPTGDLVDGSCRITALEDYDTGTERVIGAPVSISFLRGAFSVALQDNAARTPQYFRLNCEVQVPPKATDRGRGSGTSSLGSKVWLVVPSSTPLSISQVEISSTPPPANIMLLPSQISASGYAAGLALCSNGTTFVPGSCAGGNGGPISWGTITGALTSQADLMAALAAKMHFSGTWSAVGSYVAGDVTYFSGSSYVAVAPGSGHQPDVSPTYWSLMAAQGQPGSNGATGATGANGTAGAAASIAIGTVTTGTAGSSAGVTNSGTNSSAIFNFVIPRGDTGAQGATGTAGSAASIAIGTVTTGTAGSSAGVTNSGTNSSAIFNFVIPRGDTGAQGTTGAQGIPGPICGIDGQVAQNVLGVCQGLSLAAVAKSGNYSDLTGRPSRAIGFAFDGGGAALLAVQTKYLIVPFSCTIAGWSVTADAGTATVEVWKTASGTAVPNSGNKICAAACPALATGTAIHSTTLTGWTTSVAPNDIFAFSLTAAAGATFVSIVLECQ